MKKPKPSIKEKRRGVYITLSPEEHRDLLSECKRTRIPGATLLKSGFFQWLQLQREQKEPQAA